MIKLPRRFRRDLPYSAVHAQGRHIRSESGRRRRRLCRSMKQIEWPKMGSKVAGDGLG